MRTRGGVVECVVVVEGTERLIWSTRTEGNELMS
jgi:hypothetical protein